MVGGERRRRRKKKRKAKKQKKYKKKRKKGDKSEDKEIVEERNGSREVEEVGVGKRGEVKERKGGGMMRREED